MNESTAKLPGYGFQDVILELMVVNENLEKVGKTFLDIRDAFVPLKADAVQANGVGKSGEELEELKKIRGEVYQTNLFMRELLEFFTSKKLQELEDRKEFIDLLKSLRVKDKTEKKEAPLKMGFLGKALLGIPAALAGLVAGLAEGIKDSLNAFRAVTSGTPKKLPTGKTPGARKMPARGPGGKFAKTGGGSIFDDIARTFTRMVDAISDWWKGLKKAFPMLDDAIGWFGKKLAPIGKFMKGIFGVAKGIGKFLGKLLLPLQVVLSIFDFVTGSIEGFQKTEGDLMDKSVAGLRGGIRELIKGIFAVPLDLIKSAISWIAGKMGFEEAEKVLDSFKFVNIVDEMSRLGVFDFFLFPVRAAQGFIDGFTETEGGLIEKLIGSFKLGVANLLDSLIGGFLRIIQGGVTWVASALGAEKLAESLSSMDPMDAITAVFYNVVDSITGFFEGIGNAVSKLFKGEIGIIDYLKQGLAILVSNFLAPINSFTEPFGYKMTEKALNALGLPKPDVSEKKQPGGSFKPKPAAKKEDSATAVLPGTPAVIPLTPEMGDFTIESTNITGSTITEYGKDTKEYQERIQMMSMLPAISSAKNSAPTIINAPSSQTSINQSTAVERTTILLNPMFSYA
jgi:hypothetical protein